MKDLLPTILENFMAIAVETPDQPFVTFLSPSDATEALTYGELLKRASNLAASLRSRVEKGQIVLIILEPALDLISVYLASLLCEAVPCLHPFPSPKLSEDQYHNLLSAVSQACRPCILVTSSSLLKRIGHASADLKGATCVTVDQLKGSSEFFIPVLKARATDVALLQHSSGTTGLKKGVALTHRQVLNQLDHYRSALRLTSNDRILTWLPYYHDMGLIATFLLPLVTGTGLFFMSPFDWIASPTKLLQAISKYRATLCWQPNFAYNFLTTMVDEENLAGIDLSSMRSFINCSEPVQAESHHRFMERFGKYGLRSTVLGTCYAMAENTFAVTQGGIEESLRLDEVDVGRLQKENVARKPRAGVRGRLMVSSGTLLEQNKIQVVNSSGDVLPERSVGELVVQSDSLFSGYFRSPALTQQSLRNGWYYTGDLGYLSDKHVFVLGRQKDLIIIRGRNIHPQDIEAIVSAVPGVQPGRVASFGIYKESLGTEELIVLAELVPQQTASAAEIRLMIARAVYEQLDCTVTEVCFVPPMWLLKSSSGKIARAANREKYLRKTNDLV